MRFFLALPFFLLAACTEGPPENQDTPPEPPMEALQATEPVKDYPFTGLWANSFTNCGLVPGTGEEAPIEITAKRITGYENSCRIGRIVELKGEGRYEAAISCVGEGVTSDEEAYLRLSGSTLMFEREGGASVTWTRCESLRNQSEPAE